MNRSEAYFLPHNKIQKLIDALNHAGFSCIGPQVRDKQIVYDVLDHTDKLPWGIRAKQAPGEYTLEPLNEHKAFSWANGPQAIKPILFKPSETVWRVKRNDAGKLEFIAGPAHEQAIAIIGARACDLAAMALQDQVFLAKEQVDVRYQARRQALFIVAVACDYASDNCFCVSAQTGPEVTQPFDLLMTEIEHGFVIQSGSERGHVVLKGLELNKAQKKQCQQAMEAVEQAATMQSKRIPLDNQQGLRDLLFSNLDHPRWDEVAKRCLSCGNCTSVCPSCFCHSESDKASLDGTSSTHQKEWDSCFNPSHSALGGTPIRNSIRERYRQWLTHKVGSWFDQYGSSGCVGCGRCITACPVGIDLTEELAAISGESNKREKKDDKP